MSGLDDATDLMKGNNQNIFYMYYISCLPPVALCYVLLRTGLLNFPMQRSLERMPACILRVARPERF